MNRKDKPFDAVQWMREVRDKIAKAESNLTWEERKARIQRDLDDNPIWKRVKHLARPAVSQVPAHRK